MIELIKIEAAAKRIITEPDSFAALCEYEACASPATILEMASLMRKQEEALSQAIADAHGIPAQTGMIGVTAGELSCVINWLEGGRDPKDAAKELRLYCERAWTGVQPVQQPAPVAIYQARSPEENPWSDLDKETYEHALSNGFECRIVFAAPVAAPVAGKTAYLPDALLNAPGPEYVKALKNFVDHMTSKGFGVGPMSVLFTMPTAPAPVPAASVQPVEAGAVFVHQLIDSGAENYIGQVFGTERGDVEVIARYVSGKTPQQKLAELEAKQQDSGRDAALVEQLREYAGNAGYSHNDYADTMRQAADALAAHPANVAQPVSDAPTEPHKTVLYVEDLIEILSENCTVTSAGYMGTCERVVDHRGLLELLHRALAAVKKVA